MEYIKENKVAIIFAMLIITITIIILIVICENIIFDDNEENETNLNFVTTVGETPNAKNMQTNGEDNEENDEDLEKIVDIFLNSNVVTNIKSIGYTVNATVSSNKIFLNSSGSGVYVSMTFTLENNILSTEIDDSDDMASTKALWAVYLFDAVAQMKGYEDGKFIEEFSKDEAEYYTVENEGAEIKKIDDSTARACIDLNSNFPFLN